MKRIVYCQVSSNLAADYWLRRDVFGTNVVVPVNKYPLRFGVIERDTIAAFPNQEKLIKRVYHVVSRLRAGDVVVVKRDHHYYYGTVVREDTAVWHMAESTDLAGSGAVLYGHVDEYRQMIHVPLAVRLAALRRLPLVSVGSKKLTLAVTRQGVAAFR